MAKEKTKPRKCVFKKQTGEFVEGKDGFKDLYGLELKQKVCPICDEWFEPKRSTRKTCYNPECEKEYKRRYHKEDMRERRSKDPVKYC